MPSLLLIEDEGALRRELAWLLLDAGFDVSVAVDAGAAIARLSDDQPDVVVFSTLIGDGARKDAVLAMRDRSPRSSFLDISEARSHLAHGLLGPSVDGRNGDGAIDLPVAKQQLLDAIADLLKDGD